MPVDIYKDVIIDEFRKIRHEYNNIIQRMVCLIEEEDWDDLKEYKNELLVKVQKMNGNNLLQMARIKCTGILRVLYDFLTYADEAAIPLSIIVYDEIGGNCPKVAEFCTVLHEFFLCACAEAVENMGGITLKISAGKQGFRFTFESRLPGKIDKLAPAPFTIRIPHRIQKCIFFNSFIQDDCLIRELIFSFTN